MDQRVYLDIMKNIMLPHAKDKINRNWIFQQDNNPKHCARSVKEYFQSKKVNVLEWPSQSPDLNPIEHLWEYIDRQLVGRKSTNKDNIFGLIKECWYNIPQDVLINLVDSMPRRCDAVLKANGYATNTNFFIETILLKIVNFESFSKYFSFIEINNNPNSAVSAKSIFSSILDISYRMK